MKSVWLMMLPLLLGACAEMSVAPRATQARVEQELQVAAASSPRGKKADVLNQAMLPPLQVEAPDVAPAIEQRFDLSVVAAPAAQVFTALVAGTKYSMLVPPEVSGNLSVSLKGVTVREALEAIRDLYGYEFSFRGSRILIQPNTLQTRMFQINYLASRRQGGSDVRITSSSPTVVSPGASTSSSSSSSTSTATPAGGAQSGRSADSSRVQTESNHDFWKELKDALTAVVGQQDGRAVIVNPVSGVVLVKAMPGEMRAVENYLKATQVIVDRQVMLEAKIIDVQLNEGFQAGVNWSAFGKKYTIGSMESGTTLRATGSLGNATVTATTGKGTGSLVTSAAALGKGFFGLAFQASDFAALISFLETQGDVQVLSSPRVATINNQKAVLKVGTDDYFVTNVSTTATSSGTSTVVTPSITLQPFFSGIALDVMPQIDEDGNIILHIHPAVSVVQEKTKNVDLGSMGNFTLPLASSSVSETDSIVRVQDGNIVAIGGLMSQEQSSDRSGLPGLSRAAGVGNLFGQRGSSFKKRELVILLKPTVIQGDNAWKQDLLDTQVRVQGMTAGTALPAKAGAITIQPQAAEKK